MFNVHSCLGKFPILKNIFSKWVAYLDATRRHANHGVKWTSEHLEMFKLLFPSKIFDATSARKLLDWPATWRFIVRKTVISWVKDFGIDFCWLWPCCCSFPATNWLTCGPKLNAIRRVHSVWSRFVHSYALLVAQHNVETCQSKCWALVLQVLPVSSSKLCSYRVTTENVALFGHPTPEAVSKPGSSEFLGPSSLGDKMQLILIQLILAQRLREEFVWSQLSNNRDVGK